MKKLLITTALLFTALPFTIDGVTPTVSKADARIGRPLTPLSVAGVHRRVVRRNFGVGANLGYRGFHPVARAAAVGAVAAGAATGAGYYGAGYGGDYGYGYGAPSYAAAGWGGGWGAPGWGVSVAAPGWGGGWGGWGWNRPLYSCSGPFCGAGYGGWGGGWGGWGWNRPWGW